MSDRLCKYCLKRKPYDKFYRDSHGRMGVRCRLCTLKKQKGYNAATKRRDSNSLLGKTKRCIKCRASKPVSEFGIKVSAIDGMQTYCSPCNYKESQRHKAKLKEAEKTKSLVIHSTRLKQCTKCKATRFHHNFYDARTPDGKFDRCIDCCNTHSPNWKQYRDHTAWLETRMVQ
jgi:hypothetical protein